MLSPRTSAVVKTQDCLRGTADIDSAQNTPHRPEVIVSLEDGREIVVPWEQLERQEDGTYYVPVRASATATGDELRPGDEVVIPVIAEQVHVQKRQFETGGVRVTKRAREREHVVDEPGFREQVEVKRVPINRVIDEPVSIRQEEDTLIVPVLEEELIVQKRLVLKEEIWITKHRYETHDPRRVILREEEVAIERLDPTDSGNGQPE